MTNDLCHQPRTASPSRPTRMSHPRRHQPSARLGKARILLPILLVLPTVISARAEGLEMTLRHGEDASHYRSDGIAVRLPSLWSRDFGGWTAALRPELEFNQFRYNGPSPTAGPSSLNQAGAIALLSLRGNGSVRPYAEIGAGLSYFSDDRLGNRGFSTRYQFSEHIGLGLEFADRWYAGWRFSHYSNGGAKKPNDGIDLHQLLIGFRF